MNSRVFFGRIVLRFFGVLWGSDLAEFQVSNDRTGFLREYGKDFLLIMQWNAQEVIAILKPRFQWHNQRRGMLEIPRIYQDKSERRINRRTWSFVLELSHTQAIHVLLFHARDSPLNTGMQVRRCTGVWNKSTGLRFRRSRVDVIDELWQRSHVKNKRNTFSIRESESPLSVFTWRIRHCSRLELRLNLTDSFLAGVYFCSLAVNPVRLRESRDVIQWRQITLSNRVTSAAVRRTSIGGASYYILACGWPYAITRVIKANYSCAKSKF